MKTQGWWLKYYNAILLIVISVIVIAFLLTFYFKEVKIQSDTDINDLFANVINIITLYLTVSIVIKLTDYTNKKSKEVEVEKGIIIDLLKEVYVRLNQLSEHIETNASSVRLSEITFSIKRVRRDFKQASILYSGASSINSNTTLLTANSADFSDKMNELNSILTLTANSQNALSSTTYITVSNNIITISDLGIVASVNEIDALRGVVNKMILQVNSI